jgi:hypothetical protein
MMERDDPKKESLETDCRGGQGPPRAVAPRKKKKKKKAYPKVSGLAAWSENCKWYSCLSPGELSLFCESV